MSFGTRPKPIARKVGIRSGRKPINRRGPRTVAWERVRRQLKREFEAMGITTCELQFPGCLYDDDLSFAHRMKRRFITTEEELRVVILCCVPCHNRLDEGMSHAAMARTVNQIIAGRALR